MPRMDKQQTQTQEDYKQKYSAIRKNEDGTLEVFFSREPARDPERLAQAILTEREASIPEFRTCYKYTQCFHCVDTGFVHLPMQTKVGKFGFSYACACGDVFGTGSIKDLIRQGVHEFTCNISGACDLTRPDIKCRKYRCPRFEEDKYYDQ